MSDLKDVATIELELPTPAIDPDSVTAAAEQTAAVVQAQAAALAQQTGAAMQGAPAQAMAAAVQQAPVMDAATLVLDGVQEEKKPEKVDAPYMADVNLTPEEQKIVDDFAQKIDIQDSNIVLQYGASAQKKIANFSDAALDGVKTKDLGEVGGMITNLVTELKGFDVEEESGGFLGFFKKKANNLTKLKAKYDTAENNVNKITGALESHQNTLQKDIVMLDKMYESNLVYFKELTMYIIAGKKKLEQERSTTLVELVLPQKNWE